MSTPYWAFWSFPPLVTVRGGEDCIQCHSFLLFCILSWFSYMSIRGNESSLPSTVLGASNQETGSLAPHLPSKSMGNPETGESRWGLGERPREAAGTVQGTLATSLPVSGTCRTLAVRSISACCLLSGRLPSAPATADFLASFLP